MKIDRKVQKLVNSYGNWVQKEEDNCPGAAAHMTSELYPYDKIFSPVTVNRLTIKNRVVMAPMGNLNMSEETGRPNDKMLQYFFARAKGGTGLLTTGLIPISHGIDNTVTELDKLSYFPRIDRSRSVFAGWRDLAQGVHSYGSRIFVQLTPGLGRVGNPQCLITQLKFPGSASLNPNFYIPDIPCLPLTDMALHKIIKNGGQAAADAKAAGLDGVYLHGHEGYLLEQMTNPAFNRRKAGRYAYWQNFGLDLVKEIRKRAGDSYPIMYRIDLSLALNETYGKERMEEQKSLRQFTKGRTMLDTLRYMENLVKAGVDVFDVDLGCYDNWWLPHPPAGMPAGCFLEVSRTAKEYFKTRKLKSNAGVEVPVVAVGKLGYPDLAEKALRDGDCDMVMLGRPLLADPDWCNKAYAGKVKEIRPCIGCQEGCISEFVEGGHPQCAVNPRTGFEDVMPEILPAAQKPKKIGVVGAGPSGIQFALTAAGRGHQVTLIEQADKVGGKVCPGSRPRIKFDFKNYLDYLNDQLETAVQEHGIQLLCGQKADTAWLKVQGFDAIVYNIGTKDIIPRIPGVDEVNGVQATDLLVHEEKLEGIKKAAVIGGGVVGMETAYWLKYEKGCDVEVVEMLPYFMAGACTANRGHLIHYLEEAGVKLHNCTKVVGFEGKRVLAEKNISKGVPDPYNTWTPILPENIENPLAKKIGKETAALEIEADLIVFAMGGRPDDSLFLEGQKEHVACELYNIGDSFAGGRVLEASRAAYRLAMGI